MSSSRRDGHLSPETSVRSVSTAASGQRSGRPQQQPSQRVTSNWGRPPGQVPGSGKRGYRPSTSRRTTSSRAGDAVIDPFAPIKVIDEEGVNRTPKPLVALVTSAALRQARYLGMQESVAGSEASEALLGEMSSSAFGRGWFDSASVTPQDSSADLDYGGLVGARMLGPSTAIMAGDQSLGRLLRGTNSGSNKSSGCSPSSSQRPSRTPPDSSDGGRERAGAGAAAAQVLTESDLAARHDVLLQDSGTIIMLEQPGIAVAVDSAEGSLVVAANQRYAKLLADASSSDKHTSACSQTPVVLLKHKEVQSGSSSNQSAACQATAFDIHDSYAMLNKEQGDDAEEQLGSVLPSGAVIAAGHSSAGNQSSSLSASFIRSSTQQFRPSSVSSMRSSSIAGWGEGRSTFSRPASAGGKGTDRGGAAADSHAASIALMAAEEAPPEPWMELPGLAEVMEVVEAAISQNIYLPQLMLYRDIKPAPPLMLSFDSGNTPQGDGLSAMPSLAGAGSGQLGSPAGAPPSRPSLCSTPGSARPTGDHPWSNAHTPHSNTMSHAGGMHGGGLASMSSPSMSGARQSLMGGGPGSMSGLGPGGMLSRRPSCQIGHGDFSSPSRQSSIMSMGSSRVFRSHRSPASLQQLWTWSCSLTEGRPVSSLAWNSANNNLLAAGYSSRPAAQDPESTAAGAAAGQAGGGGGGVAGAPVSAFAQVQQGGSSMVGQGALLAAPRDGSLDAPAGVADSADAAGGCVALWSLKNQFHPVWSFTTQAGVTSLDFSQRNPHMLAVGMHDGTIALYDVRSRQATPVLASTAETGKHGDPVWKVRWVDPGPEREEQLVSISTDGKVKAWTVAKGLEHSTLITLKRVPHRLISSAGGANKGSSGGGSGGAGPLAGAAAGAAPAGSLTPAGSGAKAAATVAALRGDGSGSRGAVISRNTGGMSFDFSSLDRRMYLAGTEDGHIHKCSTSYSEQYLETYHGHIGAVYGLQWSPFNPSLFLSCSGDWTIRLWQEGRQQPLMTFQSSNKEVYDVAWCPSNSTVFAAVTADGRLEVWDFAVSTLRPVCQHAVNKAAMTALLFAKDAPVIISATDAGVVQVYRLVNIAADRFEPAELQHTRLDEALRCNIMKAALAG